MSKFLQPTLYNGRASENQLKNTVFNLHDLICGCHNPAEHLHFLFKTEKCHHTEDNTVPTGKDGADVLDGLEDGVLQKILDDDFTEESPR